MDEVADDLDVCELSVPTDLLELHNQLERAGMTPEEFKEVFADGSEKES